MTILPSLETHHSGGKVVSPNDPIPLRYYIQPGDSQAARNRKYHCYWCWCRARRIEFKPLEGMTFITKTKPSPNDPIPESYYIQPDDTAAQIRNKRSAYKQWCKRRGIKYEPLPNMTPKEKPKAQPPTPKRTLYHANADILKPKYHENCTTYQDAEFRLTELTAMRDREKDTAKWQSLQSEINALRVKLYSWQNDEFSADSYYVQ